jgi:hypothetical protein
MRVEKRKKTYTAKGKASFDHGLTKGKETRNVKGLKTALYGHFGDKKL